MDKVQTCYGHYDDETFDACKEKPASGTNCKRRSKCKEETIQSIEKTLADLTKA